MLTKIQKTFKNFTTPSENSYPIIDRLLGLTPLLAGIAFSYSQNGVGDYQPLTKNYAYAGLPIVLGTYGVTQLGLTYGKDKVEQIESPKLKAVADFTVGLLDTWNNVPLYAYALNMFPKKYGVNYALAFKCLPEVVKTIEGDIKTAWNGSHKYKLSAWETIAPTLIGLAAKNGSEPLAEKYKEANKSTFPSVIVDSTTNTSIEQVLTGLLHPKKYESGKFETTLMKSIAQNICYERGEFAQTQTLLGKFGNENAILGINSSLGGALPEIMLVETFFYLLSKSGPLLDYMSNGMHSVWYGDSSDITELYQKTPDPVAAPAA
jgi:hypothetical protein